MSKKDKSRAIAWLTKYGIPATDLARYLRIYKTVSNMVGKQ